MGAACCGPTLDKNTRNIDQAMQHEERQQNNIHKLLFLGPGGSGKSTIFRQLQWLHGNGFSNDQALMLKGYIYAQITSQMKDVINRYLLKNDESKPYRSIGGIPLDSKPSSPDSEEVSSELQNAVSIIQNHDDIKIFRNDLADSIQYIWRNEQKIQNVFEHLESTTDNLLSEFLDETTEYFWNHIDRIKASDYIPNEEDIINVRYRTIGVIDKTFEINGSIFNIFDVGGQKSERKKWIHCFNEVEAVIFVISLSCFNEIMFEDGNKNRMVDALELFDTTINNKHFKETDIILFLNKKDLFKKKILKIAITECPAFESFEEYHSNSNDYEQTTSYIQSKFLSLNRSQKKKEIYTHFTCAMDRQNINNVFNDVQRIVIRKNLAMFDEDIVYTQ